MSILKWQIDLAEIHDISILSGHSNFIHIYLYINVWAV